MTMNRQVLGPRLLPFLVIVAMTMPLAVVGEFHFEDFGPPPQVWMPFQLDPNTKDQGHYFQSAGRLKPGVTLDQAKARLQLSAAESPASTRRAC